MKQRKKPVMSFMGAIVLASRITKRTKEFRFLRCRDYIDQMEFSAYYRKRGKVMRALLKAIPQEAQR